MCAATEAGPRTQSHTTRRTSRHAPTCSWLGRKTSALLRVSITFRPTICYTSTDITSPWPYAPGRRLGWSGISMERLPIHHRRSVQQRSSGRFRQRDPTSQGLAVQPERRPRLCGSGTCKFTNRVTLLNIFDRTNRGLRFDKAQQGGSMMTTAPFVYGVLSRPDENRTYP